MGRRKGGRWGVLAVVAGLLLVAALPGCNENEQVSNNGSGILVIIGTYNDNFGCVDTVTETTWSTAVNVPLGCGGIFHIAEYSNTVEYFIAQNDVSNAFDPDLWSRFDWVRFQNHLYYCQTAFSAASEAAALATPRADTTDPAASGCGGSFSWTQLD